MLKKLSQFTFAFIGLAVLFSSCKKDYESIQVVDERNIQEYITKNNITAIKDPSGFYYQITNPGTGADLVSSDSVFYSFDFKHATNASIAKSGDYNIPTTLLGYTDRFSLGGVGYTVTPIRLVMSMLKRGGSAKVIIPSKMIFGKNGNSLLNVESNEIVAVDLNVFTETHQWETDERLINKFIAANNLQVAKDPSRVRYTVSAPGTGTDAINENSTITTNYTGRLLDGTVFDSNVTGTFSTQLKSLVKGWILTLPGKVTKGGKIRIIIPSDLGYGSSSPSALIPVNSCLDFDIEIVDVKN